MPFETQFNVKYSQKTCVKLYVASLCLYGEAPGEYRFFSFTTEVLSNFCPFFLSGEICETGPARAPTHLLLLLLLLVLSLSLFLVRLLELLDALLEPLSVRFARHSQLLERAAVQLQQLFPNHLESKDDLE